MAGENLRKRENWETESGKKAQKAEQNLIKAFENYFKDTDFEIIDHPTELKNLYSNVQLSPDEIEQIYNPDIDLSKKEWGVSPDFAIKNKTNGKILFENIPTEGVAVNIYANLSYGGHSATLTFPIFIVKENYTPSLKDEIMSEINKLNDPHDSIITLPDSINGSKVTFTSQNSSDNSSYFF